MSGAGDRNGVRPRNRGQVLSDPSKLGDIDSVKKALDIATDDPMVRTPAKPAGTVEVDKEWDLDDDGDWVDEQTPGQETEEQTSQDDPELSRRKRALKRDGWEMGAAFVIHLVVMCAYIYIHVFDTTIFKKNKGVGFEGSATFGGRWKFLTYINLVRLSTMFTYVCDNMATSLTNILNSISFSFSYLFHVCFLFSF